MRRIAQRNHEYGDCGIACAAMLAGTSYEEAHEKAIELGLRKPRGGYHTRFRQVEDLLEKLGIFNYQQRRSRSWSAIAAPAIVKVNQNGNRWHWIVLVEDSRGSRYVLDPEPGRTGRITDWEAYELSGNHIHVF